VIMTAHTEVVRGTKPEFRLTCTQSMTNGTSSPDSETGSVLPPNTKKSLPTATMPWPFRGLGGSPETREASSCSQ